MRKWESRKRWDKLRQVMGWTGTDLSSMEFVRHVLPSMPEDLRQVADRFYFDDGTMVRDEIGQPDPVDSRFYQFTMMIRYVLATCLNLLTNIKLLVKLVYIVHGPDGLLELTEEITSHGRHK